MNYIPHSLIEKLAPALDDSICIVLKDGTHWFAEEITTDSNGITGDFYQHNVVKQPIKSLIWPE